MKKKILLETLQNLQFFKSVPQLTEIGTLRKYCAKIELPTVA